MTEALTQPQPIELLVDVSAIEDLSGKGRVIDSGARGNVLYRVPTYGGDLALIEFYFGAHGYFWISASSWWKELSPLEALALEAAPEPDA